MAPGNEPISVYLADDHPVFREGIARAIKARPDMVVVGEAGDGRQALAALREEPADVALLDLQMPGLDGLAVLNAVRRDGLRTRVMLLTGYAESQAVYAALAGGVAALFSKTAGTSAICDAIAATARGETVLGPEFHSAISSEVQLRRDDDPGLSPREREVLALTADGASAGEISARLHLSSATIRTHLQKLYAKLGVSDRAAAVAEGMRRRLIE